MIDRSLNTKNKVFIVNLLKCGLYDRLVEIAAFEKHVDDPAKGERVFGDRDPVEKKIAKEFFKRLKDAIREWNERFGVDKQGKVTPFKKGFSKVFDGAANEGRCW